MQLSGLRWVLLVLCVLLVFDTIGAVRFYKKYTQRPNLLAQGSEMEFMQQLLGPINASRYQAILPIPYFHTGTEWHDEPSNLNIDPDDPYCNRTYQLSMATGLPLMSHKATRAISRQAEQLYAVFRPGGPDAALLDQLNQRPILVFLDTAYFDGRNNYYRDVLRERPTMQAVYERGPLFIQEQGMRRIRHQGSMSLYEWYPTTNPATPTLGQ